MSNGTKKKTPQNQEICSSIFFFKYNKMFQLVAEEGAEERAKVRLPEKAKKSVREADPNRDEVALSVIQTRKDRFRVSIN